VTDLAPARRLWTGRFHGVLSTHSRAEPGYPFGSVIPYCLDRQGRPIFLFSPLAQHHQNLHADPRCALTLMEPVAGDVQQGIRLTGLAECVPLPAEDSGGERYFRYYPRGRTYRDQLGFELFRMTPRRFHYNGGFATARWLGADRVLHASGFDEAAEDRLIARLEPVHLPRLAARFPGAAEPDEPVRIAGVDPLGLDLGRGESLGRLHFPEPLASQAAIDAWLRTLS
jgi:putative heme iron utilization protein